MSLFPRFLASKNNVKGATLLEIIMLTYAFNPRNVKNNTEAKHYLAGIILVRGRAWKHLLL